MFGDSQMKQCLIAMRTYCVLVVGLSNIQLWSSSLIGSACMYDLTASLCALVDWDECERYMRS